ncbi:hypothetical protein EVAR_57889_1 [Eumeta japonica]|uniref:Uncharacterized protein n=1 Tax=Eumeta variegata TaxID=151549 RepID=A0A4C1YS20_EUMVA|nr:hypothetical protein EVAR_57889_1 [Eumeta japonica]
MNSAYYLAEKCDEFVYQDPWGGISLMFAANHSSKVLMPNNTYVSIVINAGTTITSAPDQQGRVQVFQSKIRSCNALVTPMGLRVSMGGDDYLLSDASPARLLFDNALKKGRSLRAREHINPPVVDLVSDPHWAGVGGFKS